MSIRRFLVVAAALSVLLFAAGCGGSDDSTTASSDNPSDSSSGSSGSPSDGSSGNPSDGSSGSPSDGSSENPSGSTPDGLPDGSPGSTPGDSSGPSSGNSSGKGGKATGGAGSTADAAFIKEVKTVCQRNKELFEGEAGAFIVKSNKNPPKPTEASPEIVLVETIFVPNYQREVDELSALDPPSGDEGWFGEFLEALQQVVDETSDNPQGFIDSGGSFGEASRLAKAHDIAGCTET